MIYTLMMHGCYYYWIFLNITRCKNFTRFLKYFVYLALFQTIKQRFFELNTKKRNIICTHHHICVVFVFKHSCFFNCLATHKKKINCKHINHWWKLVGRKKFFLLYFKGYFDDAIPSVLSSLLDMWVFILVCITYFLE